MPTSGGQTLISDVDGLKSALRALEIKLSDTTNIAVRTANGLNTVERKTDNLSSKIDIVDGKATRSLSTANGASNEAKNATGVANKADNKANKALNVSNETQGTARRALVVGERAEIVGTKADRDAAAAFGQANNASAQATKAASDAELSKGLSIQTRRVAETAISEAKASTLVAKEASALSKATRGIADNAVGVAKAAQRAIDIVDNKIASVVGQVGRLASKVADVALDAAEAIGISRKALTTAGKVAGDLLGLAARVAGLASTVIEILQLVAFAEALGSRIDGIERELTSLGDAVSNILGRQLPTIRGIARNALEVASSVRGVADYAVSLGNSASSQASSAIAKS
ncbi:alanine-zipper protein [Halotia branconii]|uniref:Alanine-zipper protein n=1 Tax=Halotia branconii CENA392 TaxID=1539056 RepID=A0AAJ6P9P3_9CYAN|nr:alanine-zipper protein [Halotia branconii]WGV25946.1 alanine-zipper protein [Halotia branconii CENA392]